VVSNTAKKSQYVYNVLRLTTLHTGGQTHESKSESVGLHRENMIELEWNRRSLPMVWVWRFFWLILCPQTSRTLTLCKIKYPRAEQCSKNVLGSETPTGKRKCEQGIAEIFTAHGRFSINDTEPRQTDADGLYRQIEGERRGNNNKLS
jgi:hypothetical protein